MILPCEVTVQQHLHDVAISKVKEETENNLRLNSQIDLMLVHVRLSHQGVFLTC